MDKLEFVKEVGQSIDKLADVINQAGMKSAMLEEHYHHLIAHKIVKPMNDIRSRYNQFAGLYQYKDKLPLAELGTLYAKVEDALETNLTGAILHYARGISKRAGQKITDKDHEILRPLEEFAHSFLPAYVAFRKAIN